MYFINSLTGWRAYGSMRKTTDGGLNWTTQTLPSGGNFVISQITRFSNVNKDTIWGVGGHVFYPQNGNRGVIYRTTNGGNNWLFQIPDTSIHISFYEYVKFINKNTGWALPLTAGVHTTTGGDPVFYTGVKQVVVNTPGVYFLFQNYPNPFNPSTTIRFEIRNTSSVKVTVFDITGKEVSNLLDERKSPGKYQVDFSGLGYSSGVYFYSMIIDGNIIDTKKMILIK
ncbi:MAG: T9SS C-terminal target domain-containing protein [Ignavibacteriae bacterium]|nr:MAG: T9SS C-terminal target domain-containing protein [Ignavibacteriota bacterium]